MKNIYLIGMMGAGKTATGKALANLMGMDFLDLDEVIEGETCRTINEIFEKEGEPFFRAVERKVLERSAARTQTVVATGGGVVLDPRNVKTMHGTGRMVYLAASLETLWQRTKNKRDRPLLAVSNPRQVLHELCQVRSPLYETAAQWKIGTDGLTPEAVAQRIVDQYLSLKSE